MQHLCSSPQYLQQIGDRTDLSQKMFSGGSVDSAGGSPSPAHRPVTPAPCSQHGDALGAAHTEPAHRHTQHIKQSADDDHM